MKSKVFRTCVGVGGTFIFVLTRPAMAQTVEPAQSTELGEIVVTAQKREQRLQDVGLAVTAIGAEELATQRISTLADLAQAVPGLVYTQSQANTPVYTLRGVGFFESSLAAYPDVATYIDQTPLPLPVMSTLTAFDLERVEVLKGPQGTLFGNNATGGAINFIAAKPSSQFGAGVSLGFARFNTTDIEAYVTGALSDTVNARLAVKAVKGDGWQQSYTRDDTTGRTDNGAFRLLFDLKPVEGLSVSVNLNGWLDRDDPQSPQYFRLTPQNLPGTAGLSGTVPGNLPLFSYPLSPLTPRATDFDPGRKPAADNGFWQLAVRVDYELTSSLDLTSISSYARNTIDSNIEYDGTALTAQDLGAEEGAISSVTQELRLANNASELMHWVVGGNFEHTNVAESTVDLTADATSAIINGFSNSQFSSNQEMKNYAGFANLEYNIDPKVTLKTGVRYTVADR